MTDSSIDRSIHRWLLPCVVVVAGGLLAPPATAGSFLQFSKVFTPSTVGPGSTSRLIYTIDNSGPATQQLSFDNALPLGMSVASVPGVSTTCINARIFAPEGATAISMQEGRLVTGGSCQVEVNVVATTTATSTTSDLSSSQGNAPPAVATLTVSPTLPGVSASFSPAEIPFGADSVLTITIDNASNATALGALSISGTLPGGLVVSSVDAPVTTCGAPQFPATPNAAPGQQTFTLFANGFLPSFSTLGAGETCTFTLRVQPTRAGTFGVVTNAVTVGGQSAGLATAVLDAEPRDFTRVFAPRNVAPGGSLDAVYTLSNFNRTSSAAEIGFTDDFGSVVSGAVVSAIDIGADCGVAATASGIGTGVLTFADGTLGPAETCTFTATIGVPAGASGGVFLATSSPPSYLEGNQPRTWTRQVIF